MSNSSQSHTSRKDLRQWLLAVVIVLGILLFFVFDLQRFLTLEYLQASRESFATTYVESPFTVSLIYFLIYVISTALSVPGAVVLTLGEGPCLVWAGVCCWCPSPVAWEPLWQ